MELVPLSLCTWGASGEGALAEPSLAPACAPSTTRGEDLTCCLGEPTALGLPPPGEEGGPRSHTRTWTHTLTPGRTQRLTAPHSQAHTAGGPESKEVPLAFGPWEVPFPMSLFAGALLPALGFPREPSPAGCGDRATDHSSVFLVQTLTAHPPSPDTFYLITCHC